MCGLTLIPIQAKTIRVGVSLNRTKVRFHTDSKLKILHNRRTVRTVPGGSTFRIWRGTGNGAGLDQPGWVVQVGAYSRHSSVEQCQSTLARFTDEKPRVKYVRKRNLYFVYFGPYQSLSEASW